ncbi:MAG: MBL fold metallo-hydrolase [Alphaproteobacteria bacterium]|jgi:hydroxyacylglutathione hydrolase|nr:MBL fold metallo-hydrolase [Rhodospirillaceae bacterium]MBT6202342.1 MBL fold metallo-hydrolase [Rhodospirillaceae bacterium]MBT6510286.1 MBL fold metallo-hydrolase [Rhodospirillaceae bacterium]MBT7648040.1 MBL fold metallo-hydrolase [Rhodospirillaceae bacterium]MDG2482777.1 MBL fold metallo-hydrolase [Alphaproteobacteria bacterium]
MIDLNANFPLQQWVCLPCGYNMIGKMPDVCPFCGARHDKFVSWEAGEETYRVGSTPVAEGITQLKSSPRLGLEHACYRIETADGPVWIDCPSAFNRTLEPVSDIFFTHKDFMGASNQYRAQWDAKVHIHQAETLSPLAAAFSVDDAFTGDFTSHGIEAFQIGGHTSGFTVYFYSNVLFACDFAFPPNKAMRLNPFSDKTEIAAGGDRLLQLARERRPRLVTGYNFVVDGDDWLGFFEGALKRAA